jgi:hypothetical protein
MGVVLSSLRKRLTYANVTATAGLFVALGGTSYAVMSIGSTDVVNNSLRSVDLRNNSVLSKDIRDRTISGQDLRRNGVGGGAVKESSLGQVPTARNSERVGGVTVAELRVTCPPDTVGQAGLCVERVARSADGFFGATNACDNVGRGLPNMPQLDLVARFHGPLSGQGEWTSSVYRNPDNGSDLADQLEAVVLTSGGVVSYDRVNLAVQHAFRCVALPSN